MRIPAFFAYKDGHLCLSVTARQSERPEVVTTYYPFFAIPKSDCAWLIGAEAFDLGGGCYRPRHIDVNRLYCLQNGGQTLPIATVSAPIPCPKVRRGVQVRYRDGVWQKCLKKGWVYA